MRQILLRNAKRRPPARFLRSRDRRRYRGHHRGRHFFCHICCFRQYRPYSAPVTERTVQTLFTFARSTTIVSEVWTGGVPGVDGV